MASTGNLTSYHADAQRGKRAVERAGVLLGYRGTCVHEAWMAYSSYTTCRHSLCGVHLLRELIYFEEASEEQRTWAAPLKELLREMKHAVEAGVAGGARRMAPERMKHYGERFDELVRREREVVDEELSRAAPESAGAQRRERSSAEALRRWARS